MNIATLTTTSGHTWSTSISASYDEAKNYFLGKFFQVGSFDETKPNEGFTSEQVVKMAFTEHSHAQGLLMEVETVATLDSL
jgi:hypothetical protein